MKATIFLIIFSISLTQAFPQSGHTDVREMGMGGTSVASMPFRDFSGNIAYIPAEPLSLINCGASNHFSIKQLSDFFIAYLKGINGKSSVRINLCRSGIENFSGQSAEAGIAKKLGAKFSAGISLQYHRWVLGDKYDDSNTLISTIGFAVNPWRKLSFGVVVRNPVRSRANAIESERLPSQINSGLSLELSDKITICSAALLQNGIPLSTGLGIEYRYHDLLRIRTGWHTVPESLSFGAGLDIKNFILDVAFRTHPVLGNSSAVSFSFQL